MANRPQRNRRAPQRFSPKEVCVDDFSSSDYDDETVSPVSSGAGCSTGTDEVGSLEDFIVDDEEDIEYVEEEGAEDDWDTCEETESSDEDSLVLCSEEEEP